MSFNLPAADGGGFVFAPRFAAGFVDVAVVDGADGKAALPALALV